MITPTHNTDAAPPEYQSKGLVFLAGAIKYWWLHVCNNCKAEYITAQDECIECGHNEVYNLWGGHEHTCYTGWRDQVQRKLIAERYLSYAPHMAFKGTWYEDAQVINDAAIRASNVMLVLSPPNIPTLGTDEEVKIAHSAGVPVIYAPPGTDLDNLFLAIQDEVQNGVL